MQETTPGCQRKTVWVKLHSGTRTTERSRSTRPPDMRRGIVSQGQDAGFAACTQVLLINADPVSPKGFPACFPASQLPSFPASRPAPNLPQRFCLCLCRLSSAASYAVEREGRKKREEKGKKEKDKKEKKRQKGEKTKRKEALRQNAAPPCCFNTKPVATSPWPALSFLFFCAFCLHSKILCNRVLRWLTQVSVPCVYLEVLPTIPDYWPPALSFVGRNGAYNASGSGPSAVR